MIEVMSFTNYGFYLIHIPRFYFRDQDAKSLLNIKLLPSILSMPGQFDKPQVEIDFNKGNKGFQEKALSRLLSWGLYQTIQ